MAWSITPKNKKSEKDLEKKKEEKQEEKKEEKNSKENKKKEQEEISEIEEFTPMLNLRGKSPSLEKIERVSNLESGLANVRIPRREKEENEEFSYSGKNKKEKEETKYQTYDSQFDSKYLQNQSFEELRKRDFTKEREAGFVPTEFTPQKSLETDYIATEKKFEHGTLAKKELKKDVKYEAIV